MQQPFFGSSYEELLAQMRKQVRDQKLSEQILTTLRSAFETALQAQNIVIARPERERLAQTILQEVLNVVMEKVKKGDHA
jgi:hypothetical protein